MEKATIPRSGALPIKRRSYLHIIVAGYPHRLKMVVDLEIYERRGGWLTIKSCVLINTR